MPTPASLLLLLALARPAATPAHAMSAPADSALLAPGVSRQLAEYRAARIADVRYDLRLDVTRRDTASGQVTIRFTRRGTGDAILDFRGPVLGAARVNGRAARLEWNRAHIRVPAALLHAGENRIELPFSSLIAPAGASIIRYHDATDGADYLYTLLVPSDANALFPCFDQPDLKARVSLRLTIPYGWSAVANGEATGSSTPVGAYPAGTARPPSTYSFAPTEPISTYLIAFAAGPWDVLRGAAPDGRRMRLYVRRSRAKEVDADSLFAANGRALAWLEQWFARPYPFGKFDFLLAPAFPFGGMEHPGAVFYNEESFIFRERPTLTQRLGREATIYHEVAHQWFGDLVTMKWFDDLWLKEGFATYMAAKMQAALSPESNAWKTFYLRNKPAAYAVDVTTGTTPIWQELANLDQAKSNYGAIVYNKAPGVLKQLNFLVGDTAFRDGVRRFLRQHAYANATWRDLLGAIGTTSGRDLAGWGRQYILRPGMPVIEQQLVVVGDSSWRVCGADVCAGGRMPGGTVGVRLVQRPAQPLPGTGAWPMRTQVVFGLAEGNLPRETVELRGDSAVVRSPTERVFSPAFIYANGGDYAYALVRLDSASAMWLEEHIGEVRDDLLRAQLWGSMWDLVRDARMRPGGFVRMALRELPRERDEQIVPFVLARLTRAVGAYLPDAERDSLLPEVERMLARVADDSTRPYGIRKAHLDALIAVAGTPAGLAALDARLDDSTAAGAPLRPPTRWAIVTALVEHASPTADRRLIAEARRDSTSEGKRRAFVAGAARPDSATKAEYFRRYFADGTLNEEWASASLRAFNAPSQSALTLPYLVPALDSLPWIQRNRRIFFLGSWLGALLDGQRSAEALARVDGFLREHPALPRDLRQKILQNADELRRTVRIREGR
ncbi:MAG TPA: M1 family aminopeptidase [Gemmatimonadaceae bacterium]|nr:M1 family aminopeptidase [Gemmatimonadaceae bacterium]